MIKRKPGRPRKVESTVENVIPEKRKRGRPPKAATAQTQTVQQVNVFEYRVSVSNGYGADIKTVRANSVAIEDGKLILRYGSRVVGAFSTWDDLIEVEQPTPVIPEVTTITGSQPAGSLNWAHGESYPGANTLSQFATLPNRQTVSLVNSAPPIEIVEAERRE